MTMNPSNDNSEMAPLWVCLRMALDKLARGQSLEHANG